ncbi:MAG TPA: MerR family transcriptional regulator [Oscillospiraceae bacterium]|nr:MerR family transcriptional regulator [Oscillospiraceae bacterium]
MKMSISETAKLTGVSVRTLHYYDEIGLLKPVCVDEHSGYRFYDERSLERLQTILFYRELDFPLKEIGEIISNPDFNKNDALSRQKKLLKLKSERIERLIDAINITLKGENTMNFNAFDNSEFLAQKEKYAQEAKEKWGNTDAYKESSNKTSSYSDEKWAEVNAGMSAIICEFADCMKNGNLPESDSAQAIVRKWQDYITETHYPCTKEILAGLGMMYIGDERFKANIDKCGEGTAEYMSKAIEAYCKK